MNNIIEDFVKGPLDVYREKASFDWKKLKVFLETEDVVLYQNELYKELQQENSFKHDLQSLTLEEERYKTFQQTIAYKTLKTLSNESQNNPRRQLAALRAVIQLSPSCLIKSCVNFANYLRSMGTDRHREIIEKSDNHSIVGCFCMTEIGHGSNTKGIKTTATYDKEKKCYILHTPDFEAAKCWTGHLGKVATHAIVFAQLQIDGRNYGLHSFIVAIRKVLTLTSFAGVIIGDMGEKIGLNGVDNGFMIFNNYEIPREALLNKFANVEEDGAYKSTDTQYTASLTAGLSSGRIAVITRCEAFGTKALTIAIRYSAVRKQFGPNLEEEVPVLEYQTQQYKLLPYLASVYAIRIFARFLAESQQDFVTTELHAVSCAAKAVTGWLMRDCIQECREACGGHGYLKISGLGDVRNDHDSGITYEGENGVIIQQTSNWLIKFWPKIVNREQITTQLESANFLTNGIYILRNETFRANNFSEICETKTILDIYQWLVVYLLRKTVQKVEKSEINAGKDKFWAKNDSQIFYAKNLSIAFIEHFFLQRMAIFINQSENEDIKNVLQKLFSLYGLFSLQKHLPTLYQGKYARGYKPTTLIEEAVLKLCADLKNEAVALVDAIAPPDFILNSVLGYSDGLVYKHLESALFRLPQGLTRPKWYQEVLTWRANLVKNKL